MNARARLFDQFTRGLQGLPVDKKKIAVVNLRKLVNNKINKNLTKDLEEDRLGNEMGDKVRSKGKEDVDNGTTITETKSNVTPYTDSTGINTLNPDGSILPPLTAFDIWIKEVKGKDFMGPVTPTLIQSWELLKDKVRQQFANKARHLEMLHRLQHPGFKVKVYYLINFQINREK